MIKCPYWDRDFKNHVVLGTHIGAKHPERLGEIESGKPSEYTGVSKLFDELRNEVSMRKAMGFLRFYHPRRFLRQVWNNIKAYMFGIAGYGRIVLIDDNYREHEYIMKLGDRVDVGRKSYVLDKKLATTGRGGLTTYYFGSGSMLPINMRVIADYKTDSKFFGHQLMLERLVGEAAGAKDIQFMKTLLIVLCAVCVGILYFVYTLVEAGGV